MTAPLASAPPSPTAPNDTMRARIADTFAAQRAHTARLRRSTAAERRDKIRRLRDAVQARRQDLRDALYADFRKAAPEVDLTEAKSVIDEADFALQHLDEWMALERVATPPLLLGTQSEIRYQPKGVALILSPWNYPFNLTLGPLIAALAAGCAVTLKPSEFTPHSSAVMQDLIASLYAPADVALFRGDKTVAQALLDQPFDHIYFTGSPSVGKIVMRAAAEHLASVTLELGGKSPVVVDASADLDDAARKIVWGKYTNTGQTCIAPDYVYVHASVHDALVDRMRQCITDFYGDAPQDSPDYARLVSDKHFRHVSGLLDEAIQDGATVAAGGTCAADTRYVAPTLLTDVPPDSRIMAEEIFGPLLPVLPFQALDDAIAAINDRPNPLALYIFSEHERTTEALLNRTVAGGSCVNDVLIHYMNPHLPFGGAGHSGIGRGHGVYAFREFSNARSVVRRTAGSKVMQTLYPPYRGWMKRLTDWVVQWS
ncbi:aldehyde dehydrogenase family protein [Salisaeta longa]|uniref:aldehyde dehydrogenase family protein n=1 Tax=Salisaeta longa TaxID=503170 RepID=UPI0003B7A581|nr:aldehyde dehydrogenase family protein [Salisaeta longa]